MLQEQPLCIYCGATTPGASVDHMPPITIFDNRDRPKGMEYVACEPCHTGTRPLDLLVGSLSRMYPNASAPQARRQVAEALRGLRNNHRKLFDELAPPPEHRAVAIQAQQKLPGVTGAFAFGRGIETFLARFAARVALALHYELCREIVPATGAVLVRVHPNSSLVNGEFPSDFVGMLGAPRTLRQGRKSVDDQFNYASRALEDGSLSAHIATFRVSFAVQAFVARDSAALAPPPHLGDDVDVSNALLRPGFLKQPVAL